jgi:hypothetical protein
MNTLIKLIVKRILKMETQLLKKGQKWKNPRLRASKKSFEKIMHGSKVEKTLNKKSKRDFNWKKTQQIS